MNIVAHAGPVGCVIIRAKDSEAVTLAKRRLDRHLDQMGGAGG